MLDLLVKNGKVVFPNRFVQKVDLGIRNGLITEIGNGLDDAAAKKIDARGKYVLPGLVDSHFHAGIYRPLSLDARSESASAVAGGVTTLLSYFRTGKYYMNSSQPYAQLFKEVMNQSKGNYFTDFGYNLAPITRTHVKEMSFLTSRHGVTTYKYYMFLRGTTVQGSSDGGVPNNYLMSNDPYDLGHLQRIMSQIVKIKQKVGTVRLSIHAEDPELIRVKSEDWSSRPSGSSPLRVNNLSRPPESERLALVQAIELAIQNNCPINILHVSSRMAMEKIIESKRLYPDLDIVVETAPHYLMLDDTRATGTYGKVYPPIRTRKDSEFLWGCIADGHIDTVATDHCCSQSADKAPDIWSARAGFGSVELLLPSLVSGGHLQRNIGLEKIVALVTLNPARYFGLQGKKGDIAIGYDADLTICDLTRSRVVNHSYLHSAQDFSPFDGLKLSGWAETTILRGEVVYHGGKVMGEPRGEYVNRSSLANHVARSQ